MRSWRSRSCSAGPRSRSSASRPAATSTPAASACSTPTSSSTAVRPTARGRGRATAPSCARCRSSSARPATPQRPVVVEGLTFHDTLCITQIHGGIARNVVPDRVEIALNARFAPGREAEVARREIEDLVAGEGELTWIDESPAAPPRLSEPVLGPLPGRDRRAGAAEAGLDGRRLAAGARHSGRQLRAGRCIRPTSRASGSRARRSRAWPLPRCIPVPQRAVATVAAMQVAKWQGPGTTSWSSSGHRGRSRRSAARLLCDPALGFGADGVLEGVARR